MALTSRAWRGPHSLTKHPINCDQQRGILIRILEGLHWNSTTVHWQGPSLAVPWILPKCTRMQHGENGLSGSWFHSSSDLVLANKEMAFLPTTRASSPFGDSLWLWWTKSSLAQDLTWIQCYLSPGVLKCINTLSTHLCNILKVTFVEKPNIFLFKILFQEQATTFNYTNKAHNHNCCLLYLLGKKKKLGQTIFILLFVFLDLNLKAIWSGAEYHISPRHSCGPSVLLLDSMCYYLVLFTFKEKGNVFFPYQSVSDAYHLPWHVVAAQ